MLICLFSSHVTLYLMSNVPLFIIQYQLLDWKLTWIEWASSFWPLGLGFYSFFIYLFFYDKITLFLVFRYILYFVFLFLILFMLLPKKKKKNLLTYSKIWTNDNQIQDFTKLINYRLMLLVYFQIWVNLSIKSFPLISILIFKTSKQKEWIITPFPFTNFKNIKTRWTGIISLYSPPHYSPPLYSSLSLNFQTGH